MGEHGEHRTLVIRGLALAAGLAFASPLAACRLALVLALDVSSSVDAAEDRMQREGLAAALTAPEVVEAFLGGGPVALAAFEWSGRYAQAPLLAWRLISEPADLDRAALDVRDSRRSRRDMPTALGYALGHAASVLAAGPDCALRTIDVSGDGKNNEGFRPALAYRHFPLDEVTVNALAIGGPADLPAWFEAEVIRGPGAFVEVAAGYPAFERAMRRKLVREVGARAVGALR